MADDPKRSIIVNKIDAKNQIDNSIYEKMTVDQGLERGLIIVLRSLAFVDHQIVAENPNKNNIELLKNLLTMLNDLKKEERQSLKELDPDTL